MSIPTDKKSLRRSATESVFKTKKIISVKWKKYEPPPSIRGVAKRKRFRKDNRRKIGKHIRQTPGVAAS